MGKTDLDAAYHFVNANSQIVVTSITIVGKLVFICMHPTFGTTPSPSEYTTISEASIGYGDNLLAYPAWDATNIQSPHQHLLPRGDYMPASYPLVKSDQLIVDIETKEASIDGFVDNIITITIYNP